MITRDAKKAADMGWLLTPSGDIGFIPVLEYATLPIAGDIIVTALRVQTLKSGQKHVQQHQLGLSHGQAKELASKLLAAVEHAERDAALTQGKPN